MNDRTDGVTENMLDRNIFTTIFSKYKSRTFTNELLGSILVKEVPSVSNFRKFGLPQHTICCAEKT